MADGWLCKTDVYNNVYTGGVFSGGNHGDSVGFDNYRFYRAASTSNVILTKYDSSGHLKWAKLSDGQATPIGMTTDNDGNMYLFGHFWSDTLLFDTSIIINPSYNISLGQNTNNSSYFIIKFDTGGKIVWHRTGGNVAPYGYSLSNGGISIYKDTNIYICGSFWDSSMKIGSNILTNAHDTTSDIFIAKYNSSGSVIWAKRYRGHDDEFGVGISTATFGDLYITGTFRSPSVSFDSRTLTYTIGKAPSHNAPDMYIAKLDRNGNTIWARKSFGSAAPFSLAADYRNNVYIVGAVYDSTTFKLGTHSFHDTRLSQSGFLAKYDGAGNASWGKIIAPLNPYGTGGRNNLWGVTVDPCNNVWISGVSNGGACLIDNIQLNATLGHPYSTLFVGYSDIGTPLQYELIPNVEDDNSGLSSDYDGNIYLSDDVTGQAILGSLNYLSVGGTEAMFLGKYKPNVECQKIAELQAIPFQENAITIYPNPGYDRVTISATEIINSVTISNLVGQLFFNARYNSEKIEVDIAQLPKGVYQVRINNTEVLKFIKE